MSSHSQQHFDVLVIGGGPAGMAAAVRASEGGAQVAIVDDNVALGGQIWRGAEHHDRMAASWRDRLKRAGVALVCGMRVVDQPEAGVLLAQANDEISELRYKHLVLATGARERFLPFPGWTLPNVMGAGGLQAMVKAGLPISGKRVVVAGSGPLLLAVAAHLREQGADVLMICEQVPWSSLAAFGAALARFPEKITQALQLKKKLAGIPFAAGSWPIAAEGKKQLESVTISRAGKLETVACDYLACGFHLIPNVELPLFLGCAMSGDFVQVDDFQRTTVPGIFCAGEPTAIGGVESALVEGEIAGLASVGNEREAKRLFRQRGKGQRFARLLEQTFRLRPEFKNLCNAETLVCRCEDVTHSRLQRHTSWREAKLHTRCGMGPCQGRVCGSAVEFLFGWKPDSVRPPIFPATVESLAGVAPAD
ncbi:MAG TPA: FAD-dependent oxidoreductase [Candidatus Sulfotelmatobacter sp.]|nr:FAD-dependent oxidoreductase [Candidatus Sulfotelmatobacter sp.]